MLIKYIIIVVVVVVIFIIIVISIYHNIIIIIVVTSFSVFLLFVSQRNFKLYFFLYFVLETIPNCGLAYFFNNNSPKKHMSCDLVFFFLKYTISYKKWKTINFVNFKSITLWYRDIFTCSKFKIDPWKIDDCITNKINFFPFI